MRKYIHVIFHWNTNYLVITIEIYFKNNFAAIPKTSRFYLEYLNN